MPRFRRVFSYLIFSPFVPLVSPFAQTGELQALRNDCPGRGFVLLSDTHRHSDQHPGVGARGLQVPRLRQARRTSLAAFLGLCLRSHPVVVSLLSVRDESKEPS